MTVKPDPDQEGIGLPWQIGVPTGYVIGRSTIGELILEPDAASTPWPGFTFMRPAALDEPETTPARITRGIRVFPPPIVPPRMTCAALAEPETTPPKITTGYVVVVVAAPVVVALRVLPVSLAEPESTRSAVRQGFAPRPPPQPALRPAALTEPESTPARITVGFRVFPPPPQVFTIRPVTLPEPDYDTRGQIRTAFVVTASVTTPPQVVRLAPVALEEPSSIPGKISTAPRPRLAAPAIVRPVELAVPDTTPGQIRVAFAVAAPVVTPTPAIRVTPVALSEVDTTRPVIAAGPKVDPPPPVVPRLRAAALEETETTTPKIVVGFFVPPPPPVIVGFAYRPVTLDTDGHSELPAGIRPAITLGFDIPVAPPEPPNTGLINGGGNPSRARRRKPFNITSRDSVANRDRAREAARRALERQVEQELQALRDDADLARAPRVVLSGDEEAVIILMLL